MISAISHTKWSVYKTAELEQAMLLTKKCTITRGN